MHREGARPARASRGDERATRPRVGSADTHTGGTHARAKEPKEQLGRLSDWAGGAEGARVDGGQERSSTRPTARRARWAQPAARAKADGAYAREQQEQDKPQEVRMSDWAGGSEGVRGCTRARVVVRCKGVRRTRPTDSE